jgi:hypothetical protein
VTGHQNHAVLAGLHICDTTSGCVPNHEHVALGYSRETKNTISSFLSTQVVSDGAKPAGGKEGAKAGAVNSGDAGLKKGETKLGDSTGDRTGDVGPLG